jgi:hypothetical protein
MIPDYISVKEQKEYIRWLESMFPLLYHILMTRLLTIYFSYSCQELHRCLNNQLTSPFALTPVSY